ncbi:MAG TPA: hypothetical protein VL563_15895, partial [Gemmatimonadales bacterium]|nr:hypothetical protein [Gemmatimonadales bacterium]
HREGRRGAARGPASRARESGEGEEVTWVWWAILAAGIVALIGAVLLVRHLDQTPVRPDEDEEP